MILIVFIYHAPHPLSWIYVIRIFSNILAATIYKYTHTHNHAQRRTHTDGFDTFFLSLALYIFCLVGQIRPGRRVEKPQQQMLHTNHRTEVWWQSDNRWMFPAPYTHTHTWLPHDLFGENANLGIVPLRNKICLWNKSCKSWWSCS